MHRVIIIEDDPMVAAINRRYVDDTFGFEVEAVFQNGAEALEYLRSHDVPLLILDYYMPIMNGVEFVDRLHGMGKAPAIIMVTSSSDAQTVCQMFSRGIMDYLVKPFEYDRFRTALERFLQTLGRWNESGGELKQEDIDRVFSTSSLPSTSAASSGPPQILAKGLNECTMDMIRCFLRRHKATPLTSEEIAEQVHLSRITVRRYMNYMVDTHEILSTIDYQTGGRPSIKYQYQ